MTNLPATTQTVALFLAVFAAMAIATARFRVPYTVGLVLAGLIIGIIPRHPSVELTPSLVLFVFLPPLLFDGGWTADVAAMRRNWAPIALLAVVGVVLGVAISYALLTFGARLPAQTALIFGAIVAATDPIAVLALFKSLRIDRDLQAIIENESLFNDGTTVVAFSALLTAFSQAGSGVIDFPAAILRATVMTAGGVAVGLVIGGLARFLLRVVTDQVMIFAFLTALVAYGAYLVAEDLRVSGIMAVIFAAITIAGSRTLAAIAPEDRGKIDAFWSVIAFVANTVLFILMGASIHIREILAEWPDAAIGIVAVLLGRVIIVRSLAPFSALLGRRLSPTWQNAIALAGIRGALSMALVLSLPDDFPGRSLLISMVFSVVLFTVVVQGSLLAPLLRAMGLAGRTDTAQPA